MTFKCLSQRSLVTLYKNFLVKSQSRNINQLAATQDHAIVFDKGIRIMHLDRCANDKNAHIYDYLKDYIAKDLCDRVDDLKLESKQTVLNLGSCSGLIGKNINQERVNKFIQVDISEKSLLRCRRMNIEPRFLTDYVLCDEEAIPVKEKSIDLAISCLHLHWVNDLLGCFKQIFKTLDDNRAFIGTLFGGDTLFELRSSLQLAELERLSGFSSHVAPKTTGQDIARLLQSSGFQLITVDISEVKINYPSIFELMFDLQGMGENNSSLIGSKHMHQDVLKAAAGIYQVLYGNDDTSKGVPATFQAIHFIGWKNPTKATPLKSN